MHTKNYLLMIGVAIVFLVIVTTIFILQDRIITVVVNGQEIEYETQNMLADKEEELIPVEDYKMSETGKFLEDGEKVVIDTLKTVTVIIDGKEQVFTTYTNSYSDLLAENEDFAKYFADVPPEKFDIKIEDGDTFEIKEKVKEEKSDVEVVYEDTDTLYEGEEEVKQKGTAKVVEHTHYEYFLNGDSFYKSEPTKEVVQEGKPKIVSVGTKEEPEPEPEPEEPAPSSEPIDTSGDGGQWDQVAQCESTNNWSINTGNGYYGGLQISKSTWDAYRGSVGVEEEYPHQASKSDQILVAEQILAGQGWGAWGNCVPY